MPDSARKALDQLRIDRTVREETSAGVWIWLGLAAVLLLGGLLVGWYLLPKPVPVRTAPALPLPSQGTGRTVLNASGYVTARRQATVSSKVTGKVVEVLIEEGMKVEQNQVMARLDVSNIQTSLALSEAEAGATRAALEETKALLEKADLEWNRTKPLAESGIASPSQLDAVAAEAKALRARLERQEQEVVVAERQLAVWRQELEDRIIRAPFAGVVIAKNAQPGEMISPISAGGGFTRTGIGTVVDMSSLEIEVDVNEAFLNRVQPGQAVTATLDSYPDWSIPCKVIAIIPTADRQKATVKVRIGFDQLDPRILPDMGVKVAFQQEDQARTEQTVLALPIQAIRQDNGQTIVFVVRDQRLERRAISLGSTQANLVRILGGLNAGERVVVEGPEALTNGMRVKPIQP